MQATIVDLRYNMKKVLDSIKRNEEVKVFYRGKKIAVIVPIRERKKCSAKDHPFFGLLKDEKNSVSAQMEDLRGGRYDDI